MKDKTQTITIGIVWLFFCCYFLQAFDFPNVLAVVTGAALCLIMVIQQRKLRLDVGICLLGIALASYYVIVNGLQGLKYTILYIPLVIYVLANYTACSVKADADCNRKIMGLLLALVAGFTIYGILNSYMYYAGYVVPGTRRWQDFWSREIVPGTQHTVYFLPMMAMFFPAIALLKERKWKSVLVIFITVFFCYTSLVTRSRMPLLIFVLVVLVQAIVYAIFEWETVKNILLDKRTWIFASALFVLAIMGFFLVKDTAVMSAFINNLGKDGGILNNVRFVAQRQALFQIFDHPLGGRQMELVLGNYCHNTWLDMANAGGVIPFSAFTVYTVLTIYKLACFVRKRTVSTEIKLMAVGIYTVFFLYFSVEPALDASIHYLTPWIFLNGLIQGYLSKSDNYR